MNASSVENQVSQALSVEEMQRIDKAASLVLSARVALRRWQKDEARKLLQQALKLHPTDIGALELAGDLFMAEGEQEKALKAFERGRQLHPEHAAFEEKIAICHLDLDEMRREEERKKALREGNLLAAQENDLLLDKSPAKAFSLSLLMPGAGQLYNDDAWRGVLFLATWLVSGGLWYLPIHIGFQMLPAATKGKLLKALEPLGAFWQTWFWVMITLFFVIYILAAADAWRSAEKSNQARRQGNW